ncbi:MAG: alpha/beta hydrolase [Lachnospiraceae bacterium]|nr:alpha/beta hydrolase [Lachnospiraceae bacterium]
MIEELTTVTIHNKTCHIYRNGGSSENGVGENRRLPVFYWGIGGEERASVEAVVSCLKGQVPDADFLLVAYESENWNDDFSPWTAPAVFGKEGFGGKANDTLKWLMEYCIPYIEADASKNARFLVGYSLAGLFSLWVYCECDDFAGAVSCSGSLWYEGWIDYVQKAVEMSGRDEKNYIYLSLGDKEEKTRNRRMSMVGSNTKKVYTMLCENQKNVEGILVWNQGGHFSEPDVRIARGIDWILRHFDV